MRAIAGLASYKCNLVPKDIYRLRMQDYQNAVAVLKCCRLKKSTWLFLKQNLSKLLAGWCTALPEGPGLRPAPLCRARGGDGGAKALRVSERKVTLNLPNYTCSSIVLMSCPEGRQTWGWETLAVPHGMRTQDKTGGRAQSKREEISSSKVLGTQVTLLLSWVKFQC